MLLTECKESVGMGDEVERNATSFALISDESM